MRAPRAGSGDCTCGDRRAKYGFHDFDCPLNPSRPRTRLHNCPDCRHYPKEASHDT